MKPSIVFCLLRARRSLGVAGSTVLFLLLLPGCANLPNLPDIDIPTPIDPQPDPTPAPEPEPDAWSSINWTSGFWPRAARDPSASLDVTRLTSSKVYFAHSHRPGWPSKIVKVRVDAIACFFVWRDGRWHGGKFDWIREGGQTVKTLENIHNHYGGLIVPPSGSRVAFAWVSTDHTRRTNLAEAIWP